MRPLSNVQKESVFQFSVFYILSSLLILLFGCSSETDSRMPDRNSVTGSVTLDGEALQDGSITFYSEGDAELGIRSSTSINDGKYKLLVTPGEKKVMVNQLVDISELKTIEKIPAKYNSKTTLEADVTVENRTFDFELKTKHE